MQISIQPAPATEAPQPPAEPEPDPHAYYCSKCGSVVGHVGHALGCLFVYRIPVNKRSWNPHDATAGMFDIVCIVTPRSRANVRCTCGGSTPWFRRSI